MRTVSRREKTDVSEAEHIAADATNTEALVKACEGASVIYHCVGLEYSFTVWADIFPQTVGNCIRAAELNKALCVHADNLYCYDPLVVAKTSHITTDLEYTKADHEGRYKKPFLRAQLCEMFANAEKEGRCRTVIIGASDFYGPMVMNSHLGKLFFPRLLSGKSAQFLLEADTLHSYTYIDDFSRALMVGAFNESAWGHAWHVPNADAVTTRQMAQIAAGENATVSVMPRYLQSLIALFMPVLKEVAEMRYLFDSDCVVDSNFAEKFPEFGQPTSLEDGLRETIAWYKKRAS